MKHPEFVEQAKDIPKVEKLKVYSSFVTLFYFVPLIINLIIFFLYDKSRKSIDVDKEYYKGKKWWQI